MLGILVAIIILVGLLYLSLVMYQHWLLRRVRLVERKNKRVQEESLKRLIDRVGQLTLAGQSLTEFRSYEQRYWRIHNRDFDTVDQLIQAIERDSRGLAVLKTRAEYRKAKQVVNGIALSLSDIKKGLQQLTDISSSHRKAAVELSRMYHVIHKNLLTKHYIYGPSVEKLQSMLERISGKYRRFLHLIKMGDHVHAQDLLRQLKSSTALLQSAMKTVPVLYRNLATVYPKQIDEIHHGYRYMIQSGYRFPEENLGGAIKYVFNKVKKTVALLVDVNVSEIKNNCHQIENMINQLYDVLAREVHAKRLVDADVDVVTEYVEHAQKQNSALKAELSRLAQNYDLNHGEMKIARRLGVKLAKIDAVHQKDLDSMAENSVIYSDVHRHQQRIERELGQIESVQRDVNRSVYNLNQEEAGARDQVDKFGLVLHEIHRQIGNLHLPGLPKHYVDFYDVVFNEVKQLYHRVNQVKISMDSINKQLASVKTDMRALKKQTKTLVTDAVLAEQLIQYSNRYYSSHPALAKASRQAKAAFDRDYRYRNSRQLIAKALDRVEPGASAQIAHEYKVS